MARKNLLDGLTDVPSEQGTTASYPMRGASKTLVRSLDELAKQADKFLEGEAVVDIDPTLIDDSFVSDRLSGDDDDFKDLVEAIRLRGQDTPILLRPHADKEGRFQVVFGHRRVRAARQLGRQVKAVIKVMDDRSHVIVQGQENSARANLTFIERALFARRLSDLGYDREVISASLSANAASISKMLSVTERFPLEVIRAIGPAPNIGRERWVALSLLVGKSLNHSKAVELVGQPGFGELSSDDKFINLYTSLNRSGKPIKKGHRAAKASWQTRDKAVVAEFKNTGKAFSLLMREKNAPEFGEFLSQRLEALYDEFIETKSGKD